MAKFKKGDIITCVDISGVKNTLILLEDYKVKDCNEERVFIYNHNAPIYQEFYVSRFTLNKKATYKNHMRKLVESAFS